jgi:hypothetical protein
MQLRRTSLAPLLLAVVFAACDDDDTTAPLVVAPGPPTAVVATIGNSSVSLAFTPPSSNGGAAITSYTANCIGGGVTAIGSGAASPITVSGLTNGTEYSCAVAASNSAGLGSASAPVLVTPAASQ